MKRSMVLVFGVLGLVGCFLPLMLGVSWFDMRHFDEGWTVWLVMAAYAVPAFIALEKRESTVVGALASVLSFGYLLFKFRTGVFDLVFHGAIGGIMMGIAAVGGLAASLLALAMSSRKS